MSKLCCLLPILFDNDLCISDYIGMCRCCGKGIPATHIEADIHRWSRHVVMLRGTGECPYCGESTEIHVYAHDDRSVRQLIRGEWISSREQDQAPNQYRWGLGVVLILLVSAFFAAVSMARHNQAAAPQLIYSNGKIFTISDRGGVDEIGKFHSLPRDSIRRLL